MDDDLIFTDVAEMQGSFSNISINYGETKPTNSDHGIQSGSWWTVGGNKDGGFKSHAYELNCTAGSDDAAGVCEDVNKVSKWTAAPGSGACNGALTGVSCDSDGIEVAKDTETSFVMDTGHDAFETSEDWFDNLSVPSFTDVTLTIAQ